MKKTLGSIWPKRSSTPRSPKSGEQDDKIAPIEVVASMAAIVSGMFGSIAGDPVADADAGRLEAPAAAATPARASSAKLMRSLQLVLAAKHQRLAVIRPAQQVLGEIEPGIGEEARARHGVAVDGAAGALVADHAAEVPDQVPEQVRVTGAPGVQVAIVRKVEPVPTDSPRAGRP